MDRLFRAVVALITSLALVACTSLQVVADGQAASARLLRGTKPAVEPKDLIVVTTREGQRHELRVTALDATNLSGTVEGSGQSLVIPIEAIEKIERDEVDRGKVLRIALVVVGVALLVSYAFARSLEKSFAPPR